MIIPPDIDPVAGRIDRKIDLGGAPEFLASNGKGTAYVAINDKNEIAEVDVTAGRVLRRWSTLPGGAPAGVSIDREHGRLFVGCTHPQMLIVMDTSDGRVLAHLPIGPGVDATKFNPKTGEAFASCRDGILWVVRETSPGRYSVTQKVPTGLMSRTMAVDNDTSTIYLPSAEFPAEPGPHPVPKPDTFAILVEKPGA
jgi:DNA-binding beta-propeller fold protein YncE